MTPEQHIAAMEARGAKVKVTERKDGTVRVNVTWKGNGDDLKLQVAGRREPTIATMHRHFFHAMTIMDPDGKVAA